jgi:hypothetical protein
MAKVKRQKDYAVMKYVADYRINKLTNKLSTTNKNEDKSKDLCFAVPFKDVLVYVEVHFVHDMSKEIYYDLHEVYEKYNPRQGTSYMEFVKGLVPFIDEPGFSVGRNAKNSGKATVKEVITHETDGRSDGMISIALMLGSLKFYTVQMDAKEAFDSHTLYEWYDDYDLHDSVKRQFKAVGLGVVAILGLILSIAVNFAFLVLMIPATALAAYYGFTGYKKYKTYRKVHPVEKKK